MKLYINTNFDSWEFEPYPDVFIRHEKVYDKHNIIINNSHQNRINEKVIKHSKKYLETLDILLNAENVVFLHPSHKGKIDTTKKLSCAATYSNDCEYFKKLIVTFPEVMFIVPALRYDNQPNLPMFNRIQLEYIKATLDNPVFSIASRKHSINTILKDLS